MLTLVAPLPAIDFGRRVANLGDLDGDGLDDAGVSSVSFIDIAGFVRAFSSSDGSELWLAQGAPGDDIGLELVGIGEVDGDGVPDVVAAGHNGAGGDLLT